MSWTPHVTVATVVRQNGCYLMVEEWSQEQRVFNQPAGHLEANETLLQAAIRETLEETGWQVKPTRYLGLYTYTAPNQVTYHRHCFVADAIAHVSDQLDDDIIACHWLSADAILAPDFAARSPLVRRCITDFESGHDYPLTVIKPPSP